MKKFISMVMAAAMVVSLVPATAFAASATSEVQVAGALEWTEEAADAAKERKTLITGPEVQLALNKVNQKDAIKTEEFDIEVSFTNAETRTAGLAKDAVVGYVVRDLDFEDDTVGVVTVADDVDKEESVIKLTVKENDVNFTKNDVVVIDISALNLCLTKDAAGTQVIAEVTGDMGEGSDVVLDVLEEGVKVTLKKVADVAEDETVKELESKLTIEAVVGSFITGQEIELKLSKGFEWDLTTAQVNVLKNNIAGISSTSVDVDGEKLTFTVFGTPEKFEIPKTALAIEAVNAKVGDEAKITVTVRDKNVSNAWADKAEPVVAAVVIGEGVTLEVEDDDLPVIWSGVDTDNNGLTVEDSHEALEVTLKETVKGALDVKKDLTMTLTPGVFVTKVEVGTKDGVYANGSNNTTEIEKAFAVAYEEGDHDAFVFERKTFTATDDVNVDKAMELSFVLELVAVPGFEGDVELTVSHPGFENDLTVTIATFKAPYTVEASQNDLIIDYRNTEVPTSIIVKEAEAGLWEDNNGNEMPMTFAFEIDRFNDDAFEGDATFTVNAESEMEVKVAKEGLGFTVDDCSEDEAAVVEISDIALYMGRSIAAGAYDLEMGTSAAEKLMVAEPLWSTECSAKCENGCAKNYDHAHGAYVYTLADYADWDYNDRTDAFATEKGTVKEGFVNVITAGRDKDDASFTKKVVVPVGEAYMIAGEETVALDVPAYINANGYTMLPVRAVAVALGINTNNVIWSQAAKQVTILYGQRIITMTVGQAVVYVNGSAIPASAAVEVVDGRAFLGLRDLANALGVTEIAYDAATKTATLN